MIKPGVVAKKHLEELTDDEFELLDSRIILISRNYKTSDFIFLNYLICSYCRKASRHQVDLEWTDFQWWIQDSQKNYLCPVSWVTSKWNSEIIKNNQIKSVRNLP